MKVQGFPIVISGIFSFVYKFDSSLNNLKESVGFQLSYRYSGSLHEDLRNSPSPCVKNRALLKACKLDSSLMRYYDSSVRPTLVQQKWLESEEYNLDWSDPKTGSVEYREIKGSRETFSAKLSRDTTWNTPAGYRIGIDSRIWWPPHKWRNTIADIAPEKKWLTKN